MTSRPRKSSAPGSGRSRAGSRPSSTTSKARTTRSTTRAVVGEPSGPEAIDRAGGGSRSKLTGRAAVLVLVLLVLAVSYASSARAWLRQRSEINQLTSDIEAQRASIADLEQEKRRLNDAAYIKKLARERFGWVMPGETGYRVIGDDGEVITDSGPGLSEPVDSSTSTGSEWWDTAWGSVEAAGQEPGVPDGDASESDPAPADDPAGHIGRNGRERPVDPDGAKPDAHAGTGRSGGTGQGSADR